MTYYNGPEMTNWQKQIVMGTILGGSSIVKPTKGRNCYLFMRSKNQDWLSYKACELKLFCSQQPFTHEGKTTRWHSNCYPIFSEFREMFYKEKEKCVDMTILDKLRDIGLAIWYGDSGKLKKDKVILNTHNFGEEGSKTIAQYFNEVGIECDITTERKNYRVSMTDEGSQTFLKTIAHRLPDFLHKELLPL